MHTLNTKFTTLKYTGLGLGLDSSRRFKEKKILKLEHFLRLVNITWLLNGQLFLLPSLAMPHGFAFVSLSFLVSHQSLTTHHNCVTCPKPK